jgi:hypothetical protein
MLRVTFAILVSITTIALSMPTATAASFETEVAMQRVEVDRVETRLVHCSGSVADPDLVEACEAARQKYTEAGYYVAPEQRTDASPLRCFATYTLYRHAGSFLSFALKSWSSDFRVECYEGALEQVTKAYACSAYLMGAPAIGPFVAAGYGTFANYSECYAHTLTRVNTYPLTPAVLSWGGAVLDTSGKLYTVPPATYVGG